MRVLPLLISLFAITLVLGPLCTFAHAYEEYSDNDPAFKRPQYKESGLRQKVYAMRDGLREKGRSLVKAVHRILFKAFVKTRAFSADFPDDAARAIRVTRKKYRHSIALLRHLFIRAKEESLSAQAGEADAVSR
ncbi:MAG: hypothetical protein JRI97_07110 [Deltaproteobacteria bacterium]|nr:hypothetical protein [Deltaproteobacteria bacterium]